MMYAAGGQFFRYLIIIVTIRCNEKIDLANATRVSFATASIAFFFLHYIFFCIGWQGLPCLYLTEIDSLSMRAKGAALGTGTKWIFNFTATSSAPNASWIGQQLPWLRRHTGSSYSGWLVQVAFGVTNTVYINLCYLTLALSVFLAYAIHRVHEYPACIAVSLWCIWLLICFALLCSLSHWNTYIYIGNVLVISSRTDLTRPLA